MEHDEHKELIPRDNHHSQELTTGHRLPAAQVPPSLLPMVLLRLGLSSDALEPELSVDTLVELLHSEEWEERLNAVRMLGRLGTGVPIDLLSAVLDDPDASVRAAALFALGNAGPHVPLHHLVAALHDPDWHVRETAVLALSKQGERIPQEVLQTALHDTDSSVRESASLALQHHSFLTFESEQPAVYEGQLWEQQLMQQKEAHQNGTTRALSSEDQNDTFATDNSYNSYNSDSAGFSRALRAQQRAYAAQGPMPNEQWPSYTQQMSMNGSDGGQMQMFAPPLESSSDEQVNRERQRDPISEPYYQEGYKEYSNPTSSHQGEKVTSLPRQRRPSKGWWVLFAIVALLAFLLGGVAVTVPTHIVQRDSGSVGQVQKAIQAFPQDARGLPLAKQLVTSQSLSQARQEIADSLHLSPDEITQQLQSGSSMQDIASNQGINPDQLHKIELSAITNLINTEMKAGNIDENSANDAINRFQNDPGLLDKLTSFLFTGPSTAPANGIQSSNN
jgi:hypothetical protein